MINYRKFYLLISVIVIALSCFIAWEFKFYEDKGQITALIDVTLTTIALTIAILEILMIKNIAEISTLAVASALKRIAEIFSVSDITKAVKTAYDIQKYLRSANNVIAHIRMQDLKFIIIPLKNDKRFTALEISKSLSPILSNLAIDINNIEAFISGNKSKPIDVIKINDNLEQLVSVLIEYESYIKSL